MLNQQGGEKMDFEASSPTSSMTLCCLCFLNSENDPWPLWWLWDLNNTVNVRSRIQSWAFNRQSVTLTLSLLSVHFLCCLFHTHVSSFPSLTLWNVEYSFCRNPCPCSAQPEEFVVIDRQEKRICSRKWSKKMQKRSWDWFSTRWY